LRRARCLQLVSGIFRCPIESVEGILLLSAGVYHLLDALDRQVQSETRLLQRINKQL
jgi:hypothetical protein